MMFGILPANHNARVAKSHPGLAVLAIVMKMSAQLARHANITTKHQVAHHAHVETTLRQQVGDAAMKLQPERHVHIETTLQLVRHAGTTMTHQLAHHARVVMMRQQVVLVATTFQLVRHAGTTMMRRYVRHEQSAKKYMHRNLGCLAKKFQLSA
jgi:hypothetical protein